MTKPDTTSLQSQVREARKRRALTTGQLAEQAGIGLRTLERLESGHATSSSTLQLLANVLGCPLVIFPAQAEA